MPGLEVASLRRNPAAAAAVGLAAVVAATLLGCLTWDGQRLVIPVAWLFAAVLGTSLVTGLQGGLGAAFTGTASLLFSFTDPRWSLRVEEAPDLRATAAFAVVALLIVLAVDTIDSARRRADAALEEQQRTLTLLDAVLDHAPVGIAFFDRDLRFVRVNEALLRINGGDRGADAHVGRDVADVLGDDRVAAVLRRVLDTGRPVLDQPYSGTHPGTDDPLHVVGSYYPVRDVDGQVAGVGALVRDVTREVQVDAERDVLLARLTRLQAATAALAQARTTDEVVAAVLDQVRRAAGASAASLSLLDDDGDGLVILGGHGYHDESLRRWHHIPRDAEIPLAEAARTGATLSAGSRAEILDRWPQLEADLLPGERSIVALPLVVEGEIIGALGMSVDGSRPMDAGEQAFLEAVAAQCSQALRRAFVNDSDRTSRERLAFLADATAALTASLELDETLERLAGLAVPRIADWCSVFLLDDGEVRPVAHAHVEPEREALVRHLVERFPVDIGAAAGAGAVIRTGQPELYREITDDDLKRIAHDEEHLATALELGLRSALVVPLQAKERTLGALSLGSSDRRFGEEELSLATEVATRAAQAVLNAELFRETSRVADVLQRSLLPPTEVMIPGVELATRFVPVGHGVDVGGDFYDVFRLGPASSPEDAYAVVIGDVRGKGSEAAAIAAAARHSIRTSGLRMTSPSAMLRELNEVLLVLAAEHDDDLEPMFCTAAVVVVRPEDDGGVRTTIGVGGHPLPMLLCGDGTTAPVGRTGSLVGVTEDPLLQDATVDLRPGEALVLYTDGVTERHAGDRFFDEEGLAAAVSRCAGFTAETMAERIELAARAFVEDEIRDDLAIVVVRMPTRTGSASSASADLPHDATAPRMARQFLREVLAAWGRDDLTEAGMLLVSEVVTNAVVHGAAPLRVTVEPSAACVRVVVSDAGDGRPEVRQTTTRDAHGRGLLLVEQLAERWGCDEAASAGGGKTVWFELA